MFPKTRSWFALGAPLELLSPLSVLRILFALDILAWPIEGLVLRWPTHKLGWLIGATVVAVAVWVALRSPRAVSRRWCHLLALLANVLVLAVAYSGTTLGPVLAAVLFLLSVASFVALFLGWKAVFGHQAVVTIGLGLVLAGPLHLGSAHITQAAQHWGRQRALPERVEIDVGGVEAVVKLGETVDVEFHIPVVRRWVRPRISRTPRTS